MLSDETMHRECLDALQQVLNSSSFARAERLRKFLSFVCEHVLAGRGEEINEHLIGMEVFDRGADYSPAADSIVRRQAHALRRKLAEYYEQEGREARVRIELPVGHYAAVFRCLETPAPAPLPITSSRPRYLWLAAGLAALLIFACGWLTGHGSTRAAALSDSIEWLWGRWLTDPAGATICLSTPRTMVVKYYPEPHPERRSEDLIPAGSGRAQTLRSFFDLPAAGELREYPSVGQAKMGEAVAAIRLTSLLASRRLPVRVEPESFLEWNHVRNDNLIVFGHSESSPWVDRLISGYPIHTQASQGVLPKRIIVSSPRPGEQAMYSIREDNPDEVYVLISMVPGIDGDHRLLAISGLSGMATQYGAEFLTTPSHVETLAASLRAAGAKPDRPPYFQAILHVDVENNKVPLNGKIELVRLVEHAPHANLAGVPPVTPRP
jgi:hypothetical protein